VQVGAGQHRPLQVAEDGGHLGLDVLAGQDEGRGAARLARDLLQERGVDIRSHAEREDAPVAGVLLGRDAADGDLRRLADGGQAVGQEQHDREELRGGRRPQGLDQRSVQVCPAARGHPVEEFPSGPQRLRTPDDGLLGEALHRVVVDDEVEPLPGPEAGDDLSRSRLGLFDLLAVHAARLVEHERELAAHSGRGPLLDRESGEQQEVAAIVAGRIGKERCRDVVAAEQV
jgi:hypothetical protein